jgi:hypothetical protein
MTPDLFAALAYDGTENRHSVLLLSVLRHLSDESRASMLAAVTTSSLVGAHEIAAQYPSTAGVFDGWLQWPGHLLIVMEAKVDDVLTREQAERYATWLGERDEAERVLWLVTREREEVKSLVATLKTPSTVRVVWSTWTTLADRALAVAAPDECGAADRLLLRGLATRLRASGLAAQPTTSMEPGVLALAIELYPHVYRLRGQMLTWLRELPFLSAWTRETRNVEWAGLSVYAQRTLTLATKGADGSTRNITWWIEINASVANPVVWPKGAREGLGLRVGFWFWQRVTAEIVLDSLRAVLGAPLGASHKSYQAALDFHPAAVDTGTYHEVWWHLYLDPADLDGTAKRLQEAIEQQAKRVAPLVKEDIVSPAAPIAS